MSTKIELGVKGEPKAEADLREGGQGHTQNAAHTDGKKTKMQNEGQRRI